MLVGNRSVLHKSPGRFLSGTVASIDRSAFSKPGMMRGAHFSLLAGVPNGHLVPSAWLLPRKGGAMSSAGFAVAALGASGAGVLGMPGVGAASFSLSFATAAGQLIVSGAGTAGLVLSSNTPLLTASLAAVGAAAFTLGANGTLGALAGGSGSAALAISGALVPYAIGSMQGSTVDSTTLTADAIAARVLAAAAAAPIAADVRRVNTYPVNGDGQTGSEWGPA